MEQVVTPCQLEVTSAGEMTGVCPVPAVSDDGAIGHLREAIAAGRHWYLALLEAIGRWTTVEEVYEGRHYRYLIAGEAFDWLLLAERLCGVIDGQLSGAETAALLFHGRPPLELGIAEFQELIGGVKYHQYLNYFYGITVEEALVLTVYEEVRKERRGLGLCEHHDDTPEVYRRIYGATRTVLLKRFRRERGYAHLKSISLTEFKEFTYWCFKYRLTQCDRARVASDTKKALRQLRAAGLAPYLAWD